MEIYIKHPFHGIKLKEKQKTKNKTKNLTFYRKEYMYEVELFHHFFNLEFKKKKFAGQTL